VSSEQVDQLISFLGEMKVHSSPRLAAAIEFTVTGIEEGYLLKGVGIIVK
jgi:hypothetical protein